MNCLSPAKEIRCRRMGLLWLPGNGFDLLFLEFPRLFHLKPPGMPHPAQADRNTDQLLLSIACGKAPLILSRGPTLKGGVSQVRFRCIGLFSLRLGKNGFDLLLFDVCVILFLSPPTLVPMGAGGGARCERWKVVWIADSAGCHRIPTRRVEAPNRWNLRPACMRFAGWSGE